MRRSAAVTAIVLAACGGGGGGGGEGGGNGGDTAKPPGDSVASARLASLVLKDPKTASKVDRRLLRERGSVSVWITLEDAPVATVVADRLAMQGLVMRPGSRLAAATSSATREAAAVGALRVEMQTHRQALLGKQSALAGQLQSVGAKELGRVQLASNAIAVKVDASALPAIARMSGVAKIRPVLDVQRDPLTRGRLAQPAGAKPAPFTGQGVRIAVLDSGIDYTHRNLGGAGTLDAYAAATQNPTLRNNLFPTDKVVDGFDFVGDGWPDFDVQPDSDPIDLDGHGTHVADIAAGRSADGTHRGIAPDAKLLAVKVCSSITPSCNGVAILQGLDFALDPNGDGDIADAVDVVNMSLGASYGQQEDDSWTAVARVERLGVIVVAAAGNSGNRPYIVSSPSTAPGAISVAQTTMSYDTTIPLVVNAPAGLRGQYPDTAQLDWAPIDRTVTADVVYGGEGCPDGPAYGTPVTGRIVLVDRGTCNVSSKVVRAALAGASGVLVGLVTEGEAISFSRGDGDTMFVPSLVITKDLADRLKAALSAGTVVNASLAPSAAISVAGSMVSTSARGPNVTTQAIKPEIGAPGATVSAVAGSGDGNDAFGGTSGATPVVAGTAALLVQAHPALLPEQIKALLMNSAEPEIYTDKARYPGVLAPVTRIGAGEVRPLRALALRSIAWVPEARSAALSFGLVDASRDRTLKQTLTVENLSTVDKTYRIGLTPRDIGAAPGAVQVSLPDSVTVPARGRAEVPVTLRIDASELPEWVFDAGVDGGRGDLLDGLEFGGYVRLEAGDDKLSVPWHVLPRRAADLGVSTNAVAPGERFSVTNAGAGAGGYELFALTGSNPNDGEDPVPGSNRALVDLRAVGARLLGGYLQFAINTYGRRAHPAYPAEFDIYVDVDGDDEPDIVLFNAENGGFGESGQVVVWFNDFRDGAFAPIAFADADLNSGNIVYTIPLDGLESWRVPVDRTLSFSVLAFDNYFSGTLTDSLGPMRFHPSRPRFIADVPVSGGIDPGASMSVRARARAGGAAASPSEQGFLVLYRNDRDNEADVVRVR